MTEADFITDLSVYFRKTARSASEWATFEAQPCIHHKVSGAGVQISANGRVVWVKTHHIESAQDETTKKDLILHTCHMLRGKILAPMNQVMFDQEDLDIVRCSELVTLLKESLSDEDFKALMEKILTEVHDYPGSFPEDKRILSGHARLCLQRRFMRAWIKAALQEKK